MTLEGEFDGKSVADPAIGCTCSGSANWPYAVTWGRRGGTLRNAKAFPPRIRLSVPNAAARPADNQPAGRQYSKRANHFEAAGNELWRSL